MTIDHEGRIAIGPLTPAARLHVADNDGQMLVGGPCNPGSSAVGFASTLTCGNYSLLGDGTHTVINRPSGGTIFFRENNVTQMSIDDGGRVAITTLGAAGDTSLCRNANNQIATCSSSLRYKRDVHDFAGGLSLLARLRPVAFQWKDSGTADVGFAAEEVAAVDPRFAVFNADGTVEGVKYDRLTAVLVNAMRELEAEVARLRQRLAALEEQRATARR